jgi:hypothetical protein
MVLAIVVGAVIPQFLVLVGEWGHQIRQPSVHLDYLIAVVWALVLGAAILLWPASWMHRKLLLLLWIVRCVVTLGLMLVYEANYGLDSFQYFELSRMPLEAYGPASLGTRLVGQLSMYHNMVLPTSYHALKVSYAYLGLVSVYLMYCAATLKLRQPRPRLLLVLGLFPSILFWGSTFGKEPLVLFGIALYVYGVIGFVEKGRWSFAALALAGIVAAAAIRLWMGPILAAPLLVIALRAVHGTGRKLATLLVFVAVLVVSMRTFAVAFAVDTMQDIYSSVAQFSDGGWGGGSTLDVDLTFTNPVQLLLYLPQGAFTALFRPLPGEVPNAFGTLAGLENLLLLGLALLAIVRVTRVQLRDPVVQWAIVFLVVWASVYGFVSSANLGAGVRFKLQVLPVMVGLLLYLAQYGKQSPVIGGRNSRPHHPPTRS